MNKATLNLFNAIQVESKHKVKDILLERTIRDGYILSPQVARVADDALLKEISDVVGLSGKKANASFHKSWRIIEEKSQEELMVQQILHYVTTYGFERLGIYSEDTIFIPNEELDIPDLEDGVRLVVIKGLTKHEILENIVGLGSGIALKEETLNDILTIVEENKYDSDFVHQLKNRELKAKLYDLYDIVPNEPVEFLRYVVSKLTESSLLIKNDALIARIKACDTTLHQRTLDKLIAQAPKNLAEIFFRYKPIFLALKSVSKNKTFFNQLRKKADELHKPMQEDYLNSITGKIKNGEKIDVKVLRAELERVNIFRKIRLAYALKFRTKENDSIVYKVRNGKGFATDFSFDQQKEAQRLLRYVVKAIAEDMDVKGKKVYIPKFVHYALPATEKQFTGNFPSGTYITAPEKDLIVGIHWFDTERNRVDLDMSALSASGKTGWDSLYKTCGNDVLFSGDVTAAPKPNGASELFYIKNGVSEDQLLMVNYYNYGSEDACECKVLVAHESPEGFGKNYMVDPNNILSVQTVNIDKRQFILGLIAGVDKETRFYFNTVSVGNSITSYGNDYSEKARDFLVGSMVDSIDFNDVLEEAGAKIVTEKPKKGEFIDLSPEALNKNTFIDLLCKK